jgi:hypothetical protein
VLGSENDFCWEIIYKEELEDGGIGHGIFKQHASLNKYKQAQYVNF